MSAARPVRIWSPEEVCRHVGVGRGSYLLAVGQWPHRVGDGWADRVGVLDVADRPRLLLDAWVRREALPELAAVLPGSVTGGWDVMFATSWRWAWGGNPFSVWSRRGPRVEVIGPGSASVRTLGRERHHEVRAVRAEVSKGWLVHRVGLVTVDARTVWIARRIEVGPLLDFTYDGMNFLGDAGWASSLGAALAAALVVPFEKNDAALG